MTAKGKAEELVRKFYDEMGDSDDFFDESLPKRCALIAVDEIIMALNKEDNPLTLDFWQEVKKEIQLL